MGWEAEVLAILPVHIFTAKPTFVAKIMYRLWDKAAQLSCR